MDGSRDGPERPGNGVSGLPARNHVLVPVGQLIDHRVARKELDRVCQHVGDAGVDVKAAGRSRPEGIVHIDVDAGRTVDGGVYRQREHRGDRFRVRPRRHGIADHLPEHCLTQRRLTVDDLPRLRLAEPAIRLLAQDEVAALVFHFVGEPDLVVVGRDVEAPHRREHEAVGQRSTGLVLQCRTAVAAAVETHVTVAAVIGEVRPAGSFVTAAQVVVDAARTRAARSGIQVRQVRRPEARTVGTPQQQVADRPVLDAGRIGDLAGRCPGVAVVVVAAGRGHGQGGGHRYAEFDACAAVLA